jgi:hypothetical protein
MGGWHFEQGLHSLCTGSLPISRLIINRAGSIIRFFAADIEIVPALFGGSENSQIDLSVVNPLFCIENPMG